MKKITFLTLGLFLAFATVASAQDKKNEGYKFTDVKRLPTTSMKSQDRAGTCWSWSTISFLETEIMRMGKDSVSLAPLHVVWNTYHGKAEKYVRMHGKLNFSQGGACTDVTWSVKNYGIVPLEIYKGLNYGEDVHAHGELESVLKGYVDAVIKNSNKRLSTAWLKGYDAVLDAYLGEKPEKFTWKGKEYTPETFASEACNLDMNDYISLTSFTHHPFYTQFPVEVPDNWLSDLSYNIPVDEMIEVMDNAVDKGFGIAWASDVSEKGFKAGYAVVPDVNFKDMSDSEIAKWTKMPKAQQDAELFKGPGTEKVITQELRQKEFDNWQTTDDHGMHILGKAVDQIGNKYFIVKNSWGKYGPYKGYLYVSYPFVAYKTTSILLHKDALPKALKKKLGIK